MTKTQEVFRYLLENDYIESMQAINKFGATRLSAIVFNLKEKGVDIHCTMVSGTDRYGNDSRWGRYRILNKQEATELYRKKYYKNREAS